MSAPLFAQATQEQLVRAGGPLRHPAMLSRARDAPRPALRVVSRLALAQRGLTDPHPPQNGDSLQVAQLAVLHRERDEQRVAINALQARLLSSQASQAALHEHVLELERLLCQAASPLLCNPSAAAALIKKHAQSSSGHMQRSANGQGVISCYFLAKKHRYV